MKETFIDFSGEAAKRQAIERSEAQQAQQAAMTAIEAESKKVMIKLIFISSQYSKRS